MKQESVMSLYEPTPMSPTLNTNKSILTTTSPDSPNDKVTEQMKRNASYGNLESQNEARVLVLYTGGTIGMLRNDKHGKHSIIHYSKLPSQSCDGHRVNVFQQHHT